MKLIYIDEAGIGDSKQEPAVVVAGVIVDPDKQYSAVHAHLRALLARYILPEDQEGFIFHASDLFHEGKKIPREKYSPEQRLTILKELASVPARFSLPVVITHLLKKPMIDQMKDQTKAQVGRGLQLGAMIGCATAANSFMAEHGGLGEAGMLICEETPHIRDVIKITHNGLIRGLPNGKIESKWDRIIDTVHFAAKHEAPMLQLADICACIFKRLQMRAKGSEELAALIAPVLFSLNGHRLHAADDKYA